MIRMAGASGKKSSRAATFGARLVSTLVLWGVVLGVFLSGSLWAVVVLVAALAALGSVEFFRLTAGLPGRECRCWALVVSLAYLACLTWRFAGAGAEESAAGFVPDIAALVLVVLGAFVLRLRFRITGPESVMPVAFALLAFVYVPVLFGGFMMRLIFLPGDAGTDRSGLWLLLLVVLTTKFTDMGAYLVGTMIGRHKAIPHVSPAKSWEGYGGSVFFALGGALGMFHLGQEHLAWIGSVWHVIALGGIIALAAMVGDLAESIMKRSLQIKDSGRLLPGIGGVLDLIDSLCFSAPVAAMYVVLFII